MYKKYINRITGFLTIVMITLFSSGLSAQYISGPTTVTFGQYADYYLVGASNDQVASASWTVDYGSIQNQSTGVNYVSVLYSFQGTNYITVDYFNGFYWDSLYLQVEVVGAPLPIPTLSSVSQPTCATSTGSFMITNYNASYTYAASPSSGVSISGSTVTAPQGSYTIIATSGGSSSSPSASVTVNTQPSTPTAPTVGTITQPTVTTATGSVVLSGLPSDSWVINPGNISGSGTSKAVTGLAASQTYNFTVTNSSGCTSSASPNVVINAQPSGSVCGLSDENYIHTITPQTGTTDVSTLVAAQKLESVTYFDGLGRPMQNVAIRAGGVNNEDIITHIGYDAFGRQTKEYLPYTDTGSCGIFRIGDIDSATKSFYNATKYENTTNPYSEKEFEASPLNRVLKQAAPGNDWKLGNGHEIKLDYQTNLATDEVKNFGVSLSFANNIYTPTLTQSTVNDGFYNTNELYKTVTYDENTAATPTELNGSTVEFKNKQGQVVLKRTYSTVGTGTTNEKHDTYYVYDDYGNLTYVLPPKASDLGGASNLVSQSDISSTAVVPSGDNLQLTATNSITLLPGFQAQAGSIFTATITDGDNQSALDNLCYQYKYDHRNRLVEKKLPGKQWEYIVYDKLDRPVLTQDANLKAQNKWLFTKYDAFSRPVYTGEYLNATQISRVDVQGLVDVATTLFETKTGSNTVNGTTVYYSNDAFPNTGINLFTINYYDDYSFDIDGGISETVDTTTPSTATKSLVTGGKIRVLGTDSWITNVIYYDDKARPIYNYSNNNYLGVIQKVKSELDFVGKAKKITTTHTRNSLSTTVLDSFTYDNQNRLLTQTQKINNQADELIVSNVYDELGQLKEKGVGGKTTQSRLQTVDYTYNVRGWLKGINDGDTNNGTITMGSGDLFGFQINYNDGPTDPLKKLYNGNISQTYWKTTNPIDTNLKNYNYSYDALNRLTGAQYSLSTPDRYNENLTYDKNGNIMSLTRNGYTNDIATQLGIMDNLTYGYDAGNKLFSVEDSSNSTEGFKDGSHTTQEYSYDDNGNMKTDANKGITAIAYNHLNLPTDVTLAGGTIHYDYDATGVKQRKVAAGITTDYAGGFQYEGVNLKFFPTAEGYANNNAGTFSYIYQYKDHLGNVRLSYGDNNNDGAVTTSEIVEESNYYPFGLKQKVAGEQIFNSSYKYRYGGKEYQDELGLNMYDFGSRNYDASLGRWMNIDPQAEKYYSYSPYNYTLNSPMYYVDPNGEDIYLHYFLRNNHHGEKKDPDADKMFWAAAMTRAVDFINSGEGGSDDIMIMKGIDSMDDIEANVESDVAEYSGTYGKTAEFGLWSHSGIDGPFREDGKGNYDQLSVKDWSKIDFNWSKDANAMFYGCRSGFDKGEWSEAGNKKSFVEQLSSMSNMQDVKVWGQTQRSWPSPFTDTRVYTENIGAGNHGYPTYMVGSKIGITSFNTVYLRQPTYGYPMSTYQNGKFTGYSHQPGTKR